MSFNQVCPQKIIQKAQSGDKSALTKIYNLYKQPVFTLALNMLRDEQRANDVLQNSMLKMMKTIDQLVEPSKINGWMKRIAYNTVIDAIRMERKFVDIDDASYSDYSAVDCYSAISTAQWDLQEYLSILNERERLVTVLYAVEGFSHKEIAGKLNISEQNSRIIFSRSMKSLKQFAFEKSSDSQVVQSNEL